MFDRVLNAPLEGVGYFFFTSKGQLFQLFGGYSF